MRLKDLPATLYKEFIEKVGRPPGYRGLARRNSLDSGTWDLVEIDPKKYDGGEFKIGNEIHRITGVMGYRVNQHTNSSYFALWSRKPEGNMDSIGEPLPILTISGRIIDAGVSAVGRGSLKEEVCSAEFGSYGLHVSSYLMPLVADVLKRASEIQVDYSRARFWEADENPSGDLSMI